MGLETATFISGVTPAWPVAGDGKNQGDDHLRLIKSVLQNTFPNAAKPFYFPSAEAISGNITLDATDQNNTLVVTTTGGSVNVTLPTLAASDKGWQCDVIKDSADVNAIIVAPTSGSITSKVGTTATIRVGQLREPATFYWTGTSWMCWKPGPSIGSTENFDGATTPYGYLDADGSSYNSTNFAELFAVLASSTVKDKRGRAEIGSGTWTGLTNRVLGTNYGLETVTLVTANLPPYTPAGNVTVTSALTNILRTNVLTQIIVSTGTSGFVAPDTGSSGISDVISTGTLAGTAQGGTSTPAAIIPPSIGVKKIIRAC